MKLRGQSSPYRWLLLLVITAMLLVPLSGVAAGAPNPPGGSTTVSLPDGANIVTITLDGAQKNAYPGLDAQLSQLAAAYQKGDQATLATFGGERHVDLAQGSARVILEMAVDPQAHAAGGPTYERVALPNGRMATIEHAPRIAIRAELAAAIAATGATYETAYESWVQVLAPFGSLEALARIDGVRYVRLPFPARQMDLPAQPAAQEQGPQVGAQTTEGVSLTNIGSWHTPGYNGTGIKLAVFDFGFTGWAARQTNGDLPSGANLVLKDYSGAYNFTPDTPGNEHGTACAEIAYDMAPDATVYLYAFDTDVEFGQAAGDYTNNVTGKRVATMSIGWVNAGPYDGTGPINAIVDNAQTAGILWANAAGNNQRQHHSWTSTQYQTGNSVAFGTSNVNGFGPTPPSSVWNIPAGNTITVFLEWNDWNAARDGNQNRIDYDLYLLKWNGSTWVVVASSVGNQCVNANVPPVEAIGFTTTDNSNPYYGVYIVRYQVTGTCSNNFGHWMQLHTFNGFYTSGVGSDYAFWYRNVCNSLTIPADGNSAMAVGATFWGEDSNGTYDYGLETFSSFGPRNASGGGNPGTVVNKPDVAAPDGVSTAAYGASNNQAYRIATSTGFFGTSASAPHVAGMAASVWEGAPAASAASVRSFIQGQALYKANGGTCGGSLASVGDAPASGTQNNRFGWGRIHLNAPLAVALAAFGAVQQGEGVLVTWETASELGNLGFNLYRGTSPDGWDRQLNAALIPSQAPGSPSGFTYTWTDQADLTPGATYYYWLEAVDVNGATDVHGPVSVDYVGPTAATLSGAQAAPATALPALPWLAAAVAAGAALVLRRRR